MNLSNSVAEPAFNPEYPIRTPCQLQVLLKAFFGPGEKKDKWIYEKLPESSFFSTHAEITEGMVIHLAGFLTPLFGWKIVKVQSDIFPDAVYQDMATNSVIKVEFEKRTRDFIDHGHPPDLCDLILCWEDNLTHKEKDEYFFAKNPNLRIVELKKIFFHYDFEISPPNEG
jgi:hypothetical protein